MAVDKLIPRYLNKDNDSRLIQRTEFTDANNIRVTVGEDGDSGVIKNIKSNEAITLATALPSGFNRVVGTYSFEALNAVYVFIHNSGDNHCIYEYDPAKSSATLVLSDSSLGFRNDDYLNVDGLVYKNEAFLYFTDGRSEPKKVNITLAKAGGYPAGGTLALKELEIAVIKAPPLRPTGVWSTDTTRTGLSMYNNSFQFAAQYVYRDGDVSALGHYSELMVAPNSLNETSRQQNFKELYNELSITVPSTTTAVEYVRLFVKEGSLPFYLVEEKSHTGSDVTFVFSNDNAMPVLDDNEANKSFDAVPKTAKTQAMSGSRLMYGNYTEGFDDFNASATMTVTYDDIPQNYAIPVGVVFSLGTDSRMKLRFDMSNVPTAFAEGVDVVLDFVVKPVAITHNVSIMHTINFADGSSPQSLALSKFDLGAFSYSTVIPVTAWTTQAAMAASIGSALVSAAEKSVAIQTTGNYTQISNSPDLWNVYYGGNAVLNNVAHSYSASAAGAPFLNKPVLEVEIKMTSYNLSALLILDDSTGLRNDGTSIFNYDNSVSDDSITGTTSGVTEDKTHVYSSMGQSSFKSGENHTFGVVYHDKYGRTSGVKDLGSISVSPIVGASRAGKYGASSINIQLSSSMPAGFDRFSFVYAGGDTFSDYFQYAITEAFYVTGQGKSVNLALRGLQFDNESYVDGKGAEVKYNYSKGDVLRIISYVDTTGKLIYLDKVEFDVIELKNYEDTSTSPIVPDGGTSSDKDARKVGDFIVVDASAHADFNSTNVANQQDLWGNQCVVEIYRKKKTSVDRVYYTIGGSMTRAQHANVHTLTEGNTWYKPREMIGHKWVAGDTRVVTTSQEMESYIVFVESQGYSDFTTDALFYGKGKPYAVIKGEKEENRYSSVTYSEAMASDSPQLLVSSFNNSLANWYDFDASKGGIYGLADKSNYIITLQEDGVGLAPINKQILQAGSELLALNNNFISDVTYFPTIAGINNRGAFVNVEGVTAFFDTARGRIYNVSREGLDNLSDTGMSSYFASQAKVLTDYADRVIGNAGTYAGSDTIHIRMGYDKYNGEMLISYHTAHVSAAPSGGYYALTTNYDFKTAVYSVGSKTWTTLLDLNSTGYGDINNKFYHMRVSSSDVVWEAEKGSTYGKYFGVQYNPSFSVVSGFDASSVKTFSAMTLEGDVGPSAVSLSTISQTATMGSTAFTKKEGEYYAPLPHAAGNNEYVSIGKVKAIAGTEIEFYNMINRLPFRLGGDIYKLTGSALTNVSSTVSSVASTKKLNVSSVASVSLNDTLIVKADSSLDGDSLRGTFLEADITVPNASSLIEIYAINVIQERSNLHNPDKP